LEKPHNKRKDDNMPIYPGVTGTYPPEVWRRAEMLADGEITDELLRLAERLVQYERKLQEAAARTEDKK
jgi:hypothetical protein